MTLGPENAKAAIKRALSMGVDDGVHILNAGLEEADSVTVARVLSQAIKAMHRFDLILTGRQAADWDAGVVGCGLAQLLRIPVVTFAKSVVVADGHVTVERVLDDGTQTVLAPLPCVVTISNELGEPRKASLRETMRAAKKPTIVRTLEALAVDARRALHERETLQSRERLFVPSKRNQCELMRGESAQELAQQVIEKLLASKLL